MPQSEMMAHKMKNQPMYPQLKQPTLQAVEPFVQYGLKEAKKTSLAHAMREVAAISFLLGQGMDPQTAYKTVESWELNETL
ncbi:hypothetical protein EJF36_07650 [Bacillus sp. HMF5848]|nr:hypothetical protein EJF36_07650 [Bacillus sp. HMF5848]